MSRFIDLTGKRFGRLKVIKYVGKNKWRNSKWLCRCICGVNTIVTGSDLKNGRTKSCGCLQKEMLAFRSTSHGHLKNKKVTGFYNSWRDMIRRCTNPNNSKYKYYGNRGITICAEWMEFLNFEKDMIKDWKPGLTIERINNDKGYYRDNCRWATPKQQARNTRRNHLETFNDKTQCLAEWAEEYNILYKTLWERLYKCNWSIEKALTTPVREKRKK